MSYTPTSWQDFPSLATAITAARLNNMETGIVAATAGVSAAGLLSARPAFGAATGSFYYATDQGVLFFSDGASWTRIGLPVGATTTQYTSAAAPTGWVKYDGGTLAGSTGIYADLFAHLGSTTTLPDTQGRHIVSLGTNADISAVGASDGLTLASRSPKHNATSALTLPNHAHSVTDPTHSHTAHFYANAGGGAATTPGGNAGSTDNGTLQADNAASTGISVGNPTSNPAIGGTIGPGGSRPSDTGAFITFGILIAKL